MKHWFTCKEHEEFGEKGWLLDDHPHFDPLGGMAVAHDVLEHFPDDADEPHHELQAFGAIWFIRWEDHRYQNMTGGFGGANSEVDLAATLFGEIVSNVKDAIERLIAPTRPTRVLSIFNRVLKTKRYKSRISSTASDSEGRRLNPVDGPAVRRIPCCSTQP